MGLFPVLGLNCQLKINYLIGLFNVDDLIILFHERNNKRANLFKANMMKKYKIKPPGQMDHFTSIREV